ncbi:MAG: hypothetical protein ACT4P3_15725 [Betaproteobacteria bacterium]
MAALRLSLGILALCSAALATAEEAAVKQCADRHPVGGARAHCLAPWLDQLVAGAGAGAALAAAEELVKTGVMNDCHIMAHAVGHASWRKARELPLAFGACSRACIQGCMHGAIEASMMPAAGAELQAGRVLAFCDSLGMGSLERRQCLHGLGHGIMHQRRDNVRAAIGECEGLGGRYESDQCLGGMWMQWAHFPVAEGAAGYRAKAPSLCAAVPEDRQPRCARAVGGAAMFATGHDAALSRAICQDLPAALRGKCNEGVQFEADLLRQESGHQHQH